MKHFFVWVLRILLIAAVLFGCYELTLYLSGQFDPPAMVGYLDASQGEVLVDAELLQQGAADAQLRFSQRQALPSELPAAARQLCEEGAQALVISLSEPLSRDTADEMLALARECGVTLIYTGEKPGEGALGEENLAWYLGSDPALAGEVLGQRAAMLFREGGALDFNEDHLLQYLWLADEADAHRGVLRRYILEECEHYGVYSNELGSLEGSADALYEQALAEWGELAARPEILLCSGPEAAETARQAAQRFGWHAGPEGQELIPILCAAPNEPAARALLETSGLAGCCYYDLEGVSRALAQLAVNAAQHEFVARDTGLEPNGSEFLLPYKALLPG